MKREYIHFGIIVGPPKDVKGFLRKKAVKKLSPNRLAAGLKHFFINQRDRVLSHVKALETIDTKAMPWEHWLNLDEETKQMYEDLRPIVSLYYDYSAKQTIGRLDLAKSFFSAVQPKLADGVNKSTMLFCAETQATTSMELGQAISRLRQEVTEGLIQGDVKQAMMERVKSVFDQAENQRAWQIAVTEASRGQHAAMEITAVASGVATHKKWVLSSEACPECQPLANKIVPLGENFTIRGTGPYSEIPYPPLHPACRCDAYEVIEGIND